MIGGLISCCFLASSSIELFLTNLNSFNCLVWYPWLTPQTSIWREPGAFDDEIHPLCLAQMKYSWWRYGLCVSLFVNCSALWDGVFNKKLLPFNLVLLLKGSIPFLNGSINSNRENAAITTVGAIICDIVITCTGCGQEFISIATEWKRTIYR